MTSNSLLFKLLVLYGNHIHHRGQHLVLHYLHRFLRADVCEDIRVSRRGFNWILNPSDVVHADIFWTGGKDSWDLYHLRRLLPSDATIFDVGANIGYYSIYLAQMLGGTTRVFAFEPFPATFDRLCEHIRLNGLEKQVTPHFKGLSDSSRSGAMTVRAGNSGSANLNFEADRESTRVTLTTLDSFWKAHGRPRIHLLKIDIEGHEAKMLQGAKETITATKPLIHIELDAARLAEAQSSAREVISRLTTFGYDLYVAKRKHLSPLTSVTGNFLINAFCFHKEGHASP